LIVTIVGNININPRAMLNRLQGNRNPEIVEPKMSHIDTARSKKEK
jgi:hypothetical protein